MNEVLCLATGRTYEMVLNTQVTAHPAVAPYPRFKPKYVVPIKKGGSLEILYLVDVIIECLPEDIYSYKDKLTETQYQHLVLYHETRQACYGYAKVATFYRFYLLKEIGMIQQPCIRKGIQVSVKVCLSDIPTINTIVENIEK